MIFDFIIGAAVIWVLLTLFQPLWGSYSAKREMDRKFASDRRARAERYEQLRRMHEASPIYQQYKSAQQKNHYSRGNSKTRSHKYH